MKIRLVEKYVLNEEGKMIPYYEVQVENGENNWEIFKIAEDTIRGLDRTPASENEMISPLISIEGYNRDYIENVYLLIQSESSIFDNNIILPLLNHKDGDVEVIGYYTIATDPHERKLFIAEPTLDGLKERIERNKHNIENVNKLKDKVSIVNIYNFHRKMLKTR